MNSIPERFLWASELIDVKPHFNILEIGCGAGLLAECIAEKLKTGKLLAVDKSRPMIEKAKKRNKRFIDSGVAGFDVSDFGELDLPQRNFHVITAFNVNLFLKDSAAELKMIKSALKKKGSLFVFYQAPYEITTRFAQPIIDNLTRNGFEIEDTVLKKLKPTSAICVKAR